MKNIKNFIQRHYRHFNAAALKDASDAYIRHIEKGGKMLLTMAGAMSTAEIGISLAEMIRKKKVHAISCTGANLEEDFYNLVAHKFYKRIPNYRNLTEKREEELHRQQLNRVTDTCIPEEKAMRRLEGSMIEVWCKADKEKKRYFPYEYMYQIIKAGLLEKYYQINPKDSWVVEACKKNIPIYTPGWEDSTLGNMFVANVRKKRISNLDIVRSGLEQMDSLIDWYFSNTKKNSIGFFQIGGGIAGDFPICVVPLIQQDLRKKCKLWGYFCQISDSTTSYGSYSGAVPNEKITWGKLGVNTPKFIVESDASIVAPLMFSYILER